MLDVEHQHGRLEGRFADRFAAGRELAGKLEGRGYANRDDVLVLALPRGGVPVGYEVAKQLGAQLDVFLVRKLGVPGQEELAMGAIATGPTIVLNESLIRMAGISRDTVQRVAADEWKEFERRQREYRDDLPPPQLKGKTVILIDDGLATGASMQAAAQALRKQGPAKIVVAVPVASREACAAFSDQVDDVVCARTPEPFTAVGLWYQDFSQTSDEEVRDLLRRSLQEETRDREAHHGVVGST